jgi:Putative peptidoglycan binding domain
LALVGGLATVPLESAWAQSSAASSATPAGQTKAAQGKTAQTKTGQTKTGQAKTGQTQAAAAATKPGVVSTPKTVAQRPAVKKSTTTAKSTPPPARHSYQQQPATDRYREIQQALADRGYFNGPVDGMWGPDSADALKQFQREQKIDEDGKINALSLIALGLGPHREIASNASARRTPASSGGAPGTAGDFASGPSASGPSASTPSPTSPSPASPSPATPAGTSGITAGP